MIEIFKTNVQLQDHATTLTEKLSSQFSLSKISFDLEDGDKVLRIEGEKIISNKIVEMLTTEGYHCQILE